jgi:hypothetical protein
VSCWIPDTNLTLEGGYRAVEWGGGTPMASYEFNPASNRYHIRFRWGRAFKRPLKLENEAEAKRVIAAEDGTSRI